MNIGQALKDLRTGKQIKQYVAAQGIGMTQTYLSQVEAGLKDPSTEMIKKAGDFYGIPIAVILWKAINESDVAENKRPIFLQLKPVVDGLIDQLF